MFSIGFSDEPLEYPYDDVTIPAASGFLILDGHREDFVANLSRWSKGDYERHWHRELRSLLDGQDKIARVFSAGLRSRRNGLLFGRAGTAAFGCEPLVD